MAKPTGTKTYVLELKNGDTRKITVPAHWKLTYGNVVPYQGKDARGGEARIALRLYEGNKENLRAVYTDVVAFRDADIATLEKRTSVKRQARVERTEDGDRDVVVEARMTEWVDPDKEGGPVAKRFKEITSIPGPSDEVEF